MQQHRFEPPVQFDMTPRVPGQNSMQTALDCMDLFCLCPYLNCVDFFICKHVLQGRIGNNVCILPNGAILQKSVRKEYRMLTNAERNRFHDAVRRLKRSGNYDVLSRIHQQMASSSGAHSGPAFLPWHREYVKRVEIALRLIDPSLAIPYWDSVMDSYLPNPRDSIIWSTLFAGETDNSGNVINGPYIGFRTLEGRPNIRRSLGSEGRLFAENDIWNVVNHRSISNVLAFTAPEAGCPFSPNFEALEYKHGSVHLWVGGDMKPAYPPELPQCANALHLKHSPMLPFNKQNADGLSNDYTNNLYEYAPRPSCSWQVRSCGSPYLFCDVNHGQPHCVSKIKVNGLCRGFEGEDACFRSICLNSVCRPYKRK
ncbi:unnamed protein product [Thelazia callipaeda]|uniref:Tyrosinase_Cu-bd domain-containing protein n=1 Tax=Thelazia callipaeda TaxID=103827 RepID=A0A0N5D5Q3_THECL|nr:unnamed protein product [Thelazia callipaeda]